MNASLLLKFFGPALLTIVVALSIGKVLLTKSQEGDPSTVTIRLAHWQLESGVRQALDAVIEEYEKKNPGVRIEQVPIPERLGKNWTRTQLVGGTAPTIIQLGGVMGITDETLARFFLPITKAVEAPNPHNAGTSLEGVPWRETFIDELVTPPAYSEGLLDYYGVGGAIFTTRIFYNRELMRKITGGEDVPKTYDEFLALCMRVMKFNEEEKAAGRPGDILPIAGSRYNAPFMMNDLFAAVTQKFAYEKLQPQSLETSQDAAMMDYLAGTWNWTSPELVQGLKVLREVGQFLQPGFLQLGRDDAMFYFAQGRALMISTGSFDANSIRTQSPFEIGIFSIPIPSADSPEFKDFVLGPFSESSVGGSFVFGIVRDAPHTEQAMDFLRFLSSKTGNEILSHGSGWLPGVLEIEPNETMKPFMPRMEGYPRGWSYNFDTFPDSARVQGNLFHKLMSPVGSVEEFAKVLDSEFQKTSRTDAVKRARLVQRNVAIRDSVIAANDALADLTGDEEFHSRAGEISEGQTQAEIQRALFQYYSEKSPTP